ncbi:MAG: VWA domain-containing protein [Candidatus Sumerlaeales bacterium]|nr:VWA domain-containing protein [Candidatus Sumerlaeales bacterium]
MLSLFARLYIIRHLLGKRLPHNIIVHATLISAIAIVLVFASARPQWGVKEQRILSRGLDLIIAVDVSKSMIAQDYSPSRLNRAKEILQNILWETRGDRIGVVAFAGTAQIKCPLTLDYSMAKTTLQSIQAGCISSQGTNIGNAIDTAIKAFDIGSSGERVLVLLTDGEDHEPGLDEAIQKAASKNIKIYTIGIGTSEGIPLLENDQSYKRDNQGKVINSKLNFDLLQKVAEQTGGIAVKASNDGTADSSKIMSEISKLQKTTQQDKVMRTFTERFQLFVLLALILLIIEMMIPNRKNKYYQKGSFNVE